MELEFFGGDGTPLVFTCKGCGNVLDITNEDENWQHECFAAFDRSPYTILSDRENRLSLMPIENYNAALAEGSIVNVSLTSESDNSVSIVEEKESPSLALLTTNSTRARKSSGKKDTSSSDLQYQFSDEEKESLVGAVKTRTILWNFVGERVENRTRVKAGDAWKSATLEIGLPVTMVDLVKAEWEKMRKASWKALKKYKDSKIRPSGAGTDSLGTALTAKELKDTGFKFFESMLFLADTVKAPPTVSSLPGSSSTVGQAVDYFKDVTTKLGTQTSGPKRPRQSNSPNTIQQGNFEEAILAVLRNDDPKPHDGVTGLMLMIEEGVRKFPEDKKMTVGVRVMNFLEELKKELAAQ